MNTTEERHSSILNLAKEINSDYSKLINEHKKLEKELVNMYHCIEEVHFNHVSKSHFYMMKLQDILRRRRKNKEAHYQLQGIIEHLDRSVSAVNLARKNSEKRTTDYKKQSTGQIDKLEEEYKNR